MKIGISLPDEVFRQVERAAKRLGVSRSELLSRAAIEFLADQREREITKSYDLAFGPASEGDQDAERFRREAVKKALRGVEW